MVYPRIESFSRLIYTLNERDQIPHIYKTTGKLFLLDVFFVVTLCSFVLRTFYDYLQEYTVPQQSRPQS